MTNQASEDGDLRGMIVHFTSEMLDNPNDYGIYPTTNFYNDLEEAILDWHNKQIKALAKEHPISLYAIMEQDEKGEKFFTGLLRSGHYNRNYKLAVYKNKKTAENRLADILKDYNGNGYYRSKGDYRVIGELSIKEFKSE